MSKFARRKSRSCRRLRPLLLFLEDVSGVDAMLCALPESQREVLVMLKVSGMTIEEVALATSSSVGSVKQKAHRAYRTLRDVLVGGAKRR